MLRVLGCITQEHDLRLLLLAAVICLFACFSALSLMRRSLHGESHRRLWLIAAAIVIGCGTWATHFVAMLAYQSGMPTGYDITDTALSILVAIAISSLGFSFLHWGRAAVGGAIVGVAVGSMHFIGMAALRVPADFHWDPLYVLAACFLGVSIGATALSVAGRMRDLRSFVLGGVLLTLAIVSLHFTAMTVLSLTPNPDIAPPTMMVVEPYLLALAVAGVSIVILGSGLVGSLADQQRAERNAREASQLRRHNEELEATKRELEKTTLQLKDALAASTAASQAKSQFLANVSHELRTPLNAIIGFSEIMRGEMFGPVANAQYLEYSKHIRDSGAHLLQLINDVLDYSKVEAGRLELHEEPVSLAEVLSEAVMTVEPQSKAAGLAVTLDLPPDLPDIMGDRRRLLQVFLNLLSNAVKFTPPGGGVTISGSEQGGALTIVVADTGIGMKPEDIPLALETFRQIDNQLSRKYDGTGLGLPLSRQLMELHGGTLTIESIYGIGTSVTLTFPRDRVITQRARIAA